MNFSNNQNIWITGYKGFIGSNLIKKFDNNFNHLKVSRDNSILTNIESFEKSSIQNLIREINFNKQSNYLFHLATKYILYPKNKREIDEIYNSNLNFGLNFLKNFEYSFFDKLILTHSYFEINKNLKQNIYAKSKSEFGNFVSKKYKNKTIRIYLYDTFGNNDNRNKIIYTWVKKLKKNKDILIYNDNSTINLTSINYITEILKLSLGLEAGSYEIRNKNNIKLIDLFYLLKEITNSKSKRINLNKKPIYYKTKYKNLGDIFNIKYNKNNLITDLIDLANIIN